MNKKLQLSLLMGWSVRWAQKFTPLGSNSFARPHSFANGVGAPPFPP
jgi:hypothetical protein